MLNRIVFLANISIVLLDGQTHYHQTHSILPAHARYGRGICTSRRTLVKCHHSSILIGAREPIQKQICSDHGKAKKGTVRW
jgi:hypothetical protein